LADHSVPFLYESLLPFLFTSFCIFPQSLILSSGHPLITDFGQARPTSPAPQQRTPHWKL